MKFGVSYFFDSASEAAAFLAAHSPGGVSASIGAAAPPAPAAAPPAPAGMPPAPLAPAAPAAPAAAPMVTSAPTPPPTPAPAAASPSDHLAPVLAAMRVAGDAVKAAGGNPATSVAAILAKFGAKAVNDVKAEHAAGVVQWFEWLKASPTAPIPG